ncbi:hypothetical protein FTUN_5414 [Frigoriglobus tundricola]|uniref:Uncharacterized protein n=1 Tax=Frigoriglobus tundricola TaxID=2774151 RepID=A0A6M5YWK2_9BACT|nr:hypothetical protein FTUN_5414 [Frigoriglobus tundricola]
MFHYAVAKDERGNLRPYVWAERSVDGKMRVIGTKAPEPNADEKRAELAIGSLLNACEAYRVSPANETNALPPTLMELVNPPFGGHHSFATAKRNCSTRGARPFATK